MKITKEAALAYHDSGRPGKTEVKPYEAFRYTDKGNHRGRDMHKVIISLASNSNQVENLHQAQLCLEQILSSCRYTDAIWTKPFVSGNAEVRGDRMYLNQLCYAQTRLSPSRLEGLLKAIEQQLGRTADARRQGIVTIDLDLLLYDTERHHHSDWERPYIQRLLS